MTHHLVGMAEIAEMLGVTRQRVAQLIESYDDFPAPEVELTAGRIWSRTAIETWIVSHPNRGPGANRKEPTPPVFSFQRFTDRARRSIALAQEQARLLNHNYLGTEHILLGLIAVGEGLAFEVLERLGVGLDTARGEVEKMIGTGPEQPTGHIPFTPRAKKTLEGALREAVKLGHNYIGTEHVLLGLLRESEGVAWQVLGELGLKLKTTREAVLDAMRGVTPANTPDRADEVLERLVQIEQRLARLEDDDN